MASLSQKKVIDTIYQELPTNADAWKVLGFLNQNNNIMAFGSDSKIIGRLFEVVITPYLKKVAKKLNCTLGESTRQTVYPDFWLKQTNGRLIAIDIKSTYRKITKKGEVSKFNFTLGAYSSFLRNGTKNIHDSYANYDFHIIIGFVYTRNCNATPGITPLTNRKNVIPAYQDVQFFVQEKYKIGGQHKGSGNTNNIATIKSNNIDNFKNGNSVFTYLGKDVFEQYWSNYPLYTDDKQTKANLYTDLEGFFSWLNRNGQGNTAQKYRVIYDKWVKNNQKDTSLSL